MRGRNAPFAGFFLGGNFPEFAADERIESIALPSFDISTGFCNSGRSLNCLAAAYHMVSDGGRQPVFEADRCSVRITGSSDLLRRCGAKQAGDDLSF
jgi:hypothetical protein